MSEINAINDFQKAHQRFLEEDINFQKAHQRFLEEDINICKKYIKEMSTRIELLKLIRHRDNKFAEIEELYEKIVPVALEMNIELWVVREYIDYLNQQNNQAKAIEVAEKLERVLKANNPTT